MKVGILGSGEVAQALGAGFLKHGHEVMLGTRDPAKLEGWRKGHPKARTGSLADAAAFGELIVLSVVGRAATEAIKTAGPEKLAGKIVIDTTNPIADKPPEKGVLSFYTSLEDSQMERLQRDYPGVRFVKAFNSVGAADMVDPRFQGGPPTMFICGNDASAKEQVEALLEDFGWEVEDMGGAEGARTIEPLCILWCIPGFLRGDWAPRAFKLLR